ncbi:MAG: hypothetical protein Q8S36_08480 [Sulfuricurvum sp.]|nr:hypothetical protein [Sulfuricurvum sp.]
MTTVDTVTTSSSYVAKPKVDVSVDNNDFSIALNEAISGSDESEVGVTSTADSSTIPALQSQSPISLETMMNEAFLLSDETMADASRKPSMLEFMNATQVDAQTASDVLYGVIGSNQDLRDWEAIMSSYDPLKSARISTGAMYNSDLDYAAASIEAETLILEDEISDTDTQVPIVESSTIAESGNFAYIETSTFVDDVEDAIVTSSFALIDGQGRVLTTVSDPSSLAKQATNFGFDLSELVELESQLNESGVDWKMGTWSNGMQLANKETMLQSLLAL